MNSSLTLRPPLGEAEVVGVALLPAANQTGLLRHILDVLAVANPARLWEG